MAGGGRLDVRRTVPFLVAIACISTFASPAIAQPPERTVSSARTASVTYVSGLDPHAPGTYTQVTVRFSEWDIRSAGDQGSFSFVDVFMMGWRNEPNVVFIDPWEAGYFVQANPGDPSLGEIAVSLDEAFIDVGPLDFVCYQGTCPSFPSQVSLAGGWHAVGPQTVVASHPIDDIGAVSSMIVRTRPASLTWTLLGPGLDLPPIVLRTELSAQTQVYRAPTP